ncbi:DivIVA domain-containing protein [Micromonospora endophytica]|uniref:DivIVA domain-containing protein n=1 Tax=Micromonospora endophytica TaxID=515350 RepID=A0A2W2CS79_9ACTN|nr:DivIVA domain-containing protein [Micromonospora endophytica]RIW40083.1 DivIVA domain-containing protein [Micromonospora endophytica]
MDPGQVRRFRFRGAAFGRRGLAAEQVYAFLRAVVDELRARDGVEAGLRAENAQLRVALREWQNQCAGRTNRPPNAGRWQPPRQPE